MNFPEDYARLTNNELLMIAASRDDLVQQAALAMDSEMARRGLSYQDAHAKKKEVARLEMNEGRKRPRSALSKKYFVDQIRGRWLLLLLSPTLLIVLLGFPHRVPEEWLFPIIFASYGVVSAISAVQPWLRKTRSFWLSIFVGGMVQLLAGHTIAVNLPPLSQNDRKAAVFLVIFAGYAVEIPLFLLLQKAKTKANPSSASAKIQGPVDF